MTGFEPGSSSIGSDRSANCATTTANPSNVTSTNVVWIGWDRLVYVFDPQISIILLVLTSEAR